MRHSAFAEAEPLGALRPRGSLKRRYDAEQVYQARVEARYQFRGQDASPVLARESYTFALAGSRWRRRARHRAAITTRTRSPRGLLAVV